MEGGRSGKGGVREGDGGGEGGGGSSTSDEAVLLVTFCKFPFTFVSCVNKYSNLKHSLQEPTKKLPLQNIMCSISL